jgi:hypothetical protein
MRGKNKLFITIIIKLILSLSGDQGQSPTITKKKFTSAPWFGHIFLHLSPKPSEI